MFRISTFPAPSILKLTSTVPSSSFDLTTCGSFCACNRRGLPREAVARNKYIKSRFSSIQYKKKTL